MIHQGKQHTQCMFGNCIAIPFRTAYTTDSFSGCIFNIYQFHSTAQPSDPFQSICFFQNGSVYF